MEIPLGLLLAVLIIGTVLGVVILRSLSIFMGRRDGVGDLPHDSDITVDAGDVLDVPPAAEDFTLQYRVGDVSLCVAPSDVEGAWHIFSRLGDNGTPVYEMRVLASSPGAAVVEAAKKIGLEGFKA